MLDKPIYDYTSAEIKEKITENGMKCSAQRIAIYEVLLRSDHPSAEGVYRELSERQPSLSLSTVYNTLESFVSHGLIDRIKTDGGKMRYDARREPHAHIHDQGTDQLLDYFDDDLLAMVGKHLKKRKIRGFKLNDFQILINGTYQ